MNLFEQSEKKAPKKVKNKFNDLDSKTWMKFLKSWTIYHDTNSLYEDHINFFTKKKENKSITIIASLIYENNKLEKAVKNCNRNYITLNQQIETDKHIS